MAFGTFFFLQNSFLVKGDGLKVCHFLTFPFPHVCALLGTDLAARASPPKKNTLFYMALRCVFAMLNGHAQPSYHLDAATPPPPTYPQPLASTIRRRQNGGATSTYHPYGAVSVHDVHDVHDVHAVSCCPVYSNKNGDPRAAINASRSLHIWPIIILVQGIAGLGGGLLQYIRVSKSSYVTK